MMTGQFTPALKASGTIRPHRFVKVSGAFKGAECDANEDAIGVSDGSSRAFDDANHALDGDLIRLQTGNVVRVEFGGNVTAGGSVKSDADGKAVAVATSGLVEQFENGVALETSASTEIRWLLFHRRRYFPDPT